MPILPIRIVKLYLMVWCTLLLALPGLAQNLQSPDEFFGHPLGSKFLYHHELVQYFNHVAAEAPNVVVEKYGATYERRDLIYAIVSSPENMANLEEIRLNNLRAAGMAEGEINGMHKPIVWLSYSIHGNESAGTMSAFKVLYELANAKEEDIQLWLKEVVVILDPAENPDGYARYTHWYNQASTLPAPTTDPISWEHNEPWPGGRFNHYHFDLNRDWAWQTQVETQQRIGNYQRWMPHVHIDLHEMGPNSPYYNGWAAKPLHQAISPWQREFIAAIGRGNAAVFDREGWLYYTKETFDLFYPSYGDTWPTFNGAIGLTYEQGGSGRAGLNMTIATGEELTLKDRLEHHYRASLSTIAVAYEQRNRLVEEHKQFFETAANNPKGTYKSYILKGSNPKARLQACLELLDKNKITYGPAPVGAKSSTGFSYLSNAEGTFKLEAGDIVVSAYQPQSTLLQVLMDPDPVLEDSLTYDLTAWALPYAFELEAYASTSRINPTSLGASTAKIQIPEEESVYAYLVDWQDFQNAQFLAALLKSGIKARFSTEAFATDGRRFSAGALAITKGDNKEMDDFEDAIRTLAQLHKQSLFSTQSGLAESGKDLGSGSWRFISAPNVVLLRGDGISPTAFGEIWHYFEQQLNYPVTIVNKDDFGRVDVSAYNVVILASGNYRDISSQLKSFVSNGGKIIALENAIDVFTADESTQLGKAYARYQKEVEKETPKALDDKTLLAPYADRRRRSISDASAGSIYRVSVDATHPLGFGDDRFTHIIKRNRDVYPYMDNAWNVGTFQDKGPISGFVGYNLKEKIAQTLAFGTESYGKGSIVYFTDSPIIRGFWHNGKQMMSNAIFFVGQ